MFTAEQRQILKEKNIKVATLGLMEDLVAEDVTQTTIQHHREFYICENPAWECHKYTVCDNTEGFAWCEDYDNFESAINWFFI